MNRDNFIKEMNKMYDDCIIHSWHKGNRLYELCQKQMIEENYKNMREFIKAKEYYPFIEYEINIKKISELTNNQAINPFLNLYSLDINTLEEIYILLSKTHKAINYYDRYASKQRELKEENKITKGQKPKTNKINEVIELIYKTDIEVEEYINNIIDSGEKVEYKPNGYKVIEYLQGMVGSLNNIHYTKIQLYQNLLHEMYFILKDKSYIDIRTNKDKLFSKNLIFDIVDKLIKHYFCETEPQITEKEKIFSTSMGPFKILCQTGKINNTKGHRDEDRNRCRAICS
jgi:hypothetical protein